MKKILIDFSKVISPIGISRFVAHNLAPFLSLSEEEIRNIYKTHISELVVGTFSINALITEYLPYSHTTTTAEQLYQQFLRIPPIDTDFLSFLRKQKKSDISYYLVSDLYPELGEQLKSVLGTIFEKYLLSYEIGKKKSDPLFWEAIIEEEMVFFIDDKQNNIEQAEKYGIKGYLFTSFADLVQDWKKLGL